ncbi:sensor histidine kinase [Minwuia sp.]|uniref:sensor histidine kinase n=1 Tax=Minwuia sp. TaxID=2493630 RepID=UPI003A90F3D5
MASGTRSSAPSLGSVPTGLSRADGQTSRLSGEFLDPSTEHEYRLWRYDATLAQYRIVAWFVLVAVFPFLFAVYQSWGLTDAFFVVAAGRAVQFLISLWALWAVYTRAGYRTLDRSALAYGAVLFGVNALAMWLSPTTGLLMIIQGLMIIIACYVLYPGRLIALVPVIITFSLFFIALVLFRFEIERSHQIGIIVWTVVGNAVGFLAARQLNRFRRSEFIALRRAQQDVRELKLARSEAEQARAAAEAANQAKSAMLANTSHELRTPLNAIIGFSEMIQRQMLGPVDNPRYVQYAGDIHRSGTHLLSLIDDLLDLSKIEAGKTELHREWVGIDALIADIVRMNRHRADARGQSIHVTVDPALTSVWADDRALRQIMVNLVTNALKFSRPGTTVDIVCERMADGGACLSVRDRGPGIAPDDLKRLMQPFQQAEIDPSKPREGWGLGLALVRTLSGLHGADFRLIARDGGGTDARVRFQAGHVAGEADSPDLAVIA